MRAAFLTATRTIEVRDVPRPHLGPEDASIRVRYCGICGSDLSVFKTGALAGPDVVQGHEIVGIVEEDRTGTLAPGTRVAVFPPRYCGACMWCREGKVRYCLDQNRRAWGGYAQHAVYPSRNLIPVPDDVSDEAAAAADPLGVGIRAVAEANPSPGEAAYVNGLGPIGLFTVAALLDRGVTVIAGDPVAERRAAARSLGVHTVIDPTREDAYEVGLGLDPHGVPFAFECSGTADGLQGIFDAAGHGATIGILGVPMGPVLLLRMTVREQRAFSISGPTYESIDAALEHMTRRPQDASVVTGTVALDDLQKTMEGLVSQSGGIKVLVDPWA